MYEQATVAQRARSTDLVHLCDARPLLLSSAPFLITVHDVTFVDHPDWMPRHVALYKRAMLRTAVLRHPRAIVCDSHHTRERLLAVLPAARRVRVEVIHLGVDAPQSAAMWRPAQMDPYFLTLSTIEPRKNHLTLLTAFRYLRRSGFPLRWKIAGSAGHLAAPIVAALRAQDGVDVMDYVSDDDRSGLLRGAMFFALPSFEEGFGFPVLEAMVRGVPTVCSTGSALDEVAGEDGLRVRPTDRKGWVEALSVLGADSALRQELSDRGRRRAQRFSWDATAQHLSALYDDVRDQVAVVRDSARTMP
ncbi:MAG: hypothetical protein QOG15_734 [Solirubrobacteraceae bacterium]|jgi:glycosyltransferase involved in cell wall biosynthesis|nr:hypothetical protein [Solirubrobacteraceae bacterium]